MIRNVLIYDDKYQAVNSDGTPYVLSASATKSPSIKHENKTPPNKQQAFCPFTLNDNHNHNKF